jgi:hypothetical protein
LSWKLPLKNNFDQDGRCSARESLAGMIIHEKTKEGAFARYMAEVRALPGLCIVSTSVHCVGPPRVKSDDHFLLSATKKVGKKRAAKMPHPNEIFGISISLLLLTAGHGFL